MRTALTTSTVALFLITTAVAVGDPHPADRNAVQGTWAVESGRVHYLDMLVGGKPFRQPLDFPKNVHPKPQLRVKGDKWVFTFAPPLAKEPGGVTRTWKVTLGGGKDVKAVDLEALDGPAMGKTCRGVYALDGDALRVAYAPPGAERPAGLDAEDPLDSSLRLKRVKD